MYGKTKDEKKKASRSRETRKERRRREREPTTNLENGEPNALLHVSDEEEVLESSNGSDVDGNVEESQTQESLVVLERSDVHLEERRRRREGKKKKGERRQTRVWFVFCWMRAMQRREKRGEAELTF